MASQRDKKRDISPANLTWIEQLKAELIPEEAPDGWHTVEEIVALTGANRSSVERFLKKLPRKICQKLDSLGRRQKRWHYKMQ